ncbi:MAG TPA: hypothetical protein VGQ64_12445 [Candidatus Limnocylindrales bacterium]|jgi:hypothetical protein|nr:hypothetical protein [Candidatus Limnocylindrales bacterium]
MSSAGPADTSAEGRSTVDVLRRALIGLVAIAAAGTGLELVLLRHWDNALEWIPFAALVVLGLAVVVLAVRPGRRAVRFVRILAVLVAIVGAIGVFIHVRSNYETAPLDFRYTDSWPTTAEPIRWLLAATDTVGPSPTLAPAAITFAAIALLAATLRHPALLEDGSPEP